MLREIELCDLININYKTLKNIKGIGEVKAITILSAIEFGKRVLNKISLDICIKSSLDIYNMVKFDLENELQEKFMVIYLDTRNYVILKKILFMGTVNHSSVTARDVFREGVKNNAAKMILVHNHPAGTVNPSFDDISLTNIFIKLGKMMEIIVLDHIIVGKGAFYSFRENNESLFE